MKFRLEKFLSPKDVQIALEIFSDDEKASFIQHPHFPLEDTENSKAFFLLIEDNNTLVAFSRIIFSTYAFFPWYKLASCVHGPVIRGVSRNDINYALIDFFKQEGIVSLRYQENFWNGDGIINRLKIPNARFEIKNQKATILLNLNESIEFIYQNFDTVLKKNIRSAKNKGVTIKYGTHASVSEFIHIYSKMCLDRGIKLQSETELRSICDFVLHGNGYLMLATINDVIVGGAIFIQENSKMVYYIGATSPEYRKIPVTHLVLYEGILLSQTLKLNYFDFGGYKLNSTIQDQYFTINSFKLQFCKNLVCYEPPCSLVFKSRTLFFLQTFSKFIQWIKL